eukprot:1354246-Amorphochlora_amoeboformis.AAC.1
MPGFRTANFARFRRHVCRFTGGRLASKRHVFGFRRGTCLGSDPLLSLRILIWVPSGTWPW